MRKILMTTFLAALLASPVAFSQNQPYYNQPDSSCFENTGDNRNVVVRGATSTTGQTIIGGLLGAALGYQFGSGTGQDIATGVGAAAGAAAGAWNANRQREARIRECQRARGYTSYDGRYQNQAGYNRFGNRARNSTYNRGY